MSKVPLSCTLHHVASTNSNNNASCLPLSNDAAGRLPKYAVAAAPILAFHQQAPVLAAPCAIDSSVAACSPYYYNYQPQARLQQQHQQRPSFILPVHHQSAPSHHQLLSSNNVAPPMFAISSVPSIIVPSAATHQTTNATHSSSSRNSKNNTPPSARNSSTYQHCPYSVNVLVGPDQQEEDSSAAGSDEVVSSHSLLPSSEVSPQLQHTKKQQQQGIQSAAPVAVAATQLSEFSSYASKSSSSGEFSAEARRTNTITPVPSCDETTEASATAPTPTLSNNFPVFNNTSPSSRRNITAAQLQARVGTFASLSTLPHGSSFLQHALQDLPQEAVPLLQAELLPSLADLANDDQACYVIKALLLLLDLSVSLPLVHSLCANQALLFSLSTRNLHSRRMLQFLVDFVYEHANIHAIWQFLIRQLLPICRTQQGCISAQRILDRCDERQREAVLDEIRRNLVTFATDANANYVVQYLFDNGNRNANEAAIVALFSRNFQWLACHKYASNVVEQTLRNLTAAEQRAAIVELFSGTDQQLIALLRDQYGNYVVQTALRVASPKDVPWIGARVLPLLAQIPYAKKLESKLLSRMKNQRH